MTQAMEGLSTQAVSVPLTNSPRNAIDGYLAIPDHGGPFPGVVVIHEIFGLSDNIRDISRRFAREGYAALAVDLFSQASRVVCMMRIMNGMLLKPLNNGIVAELQSALDFLQSQPGVNAARVGVIGFCMGGTYALQLACRDKDVRAASVFYGQNPRPLEVVAQACPLVGSYPERDFTAAAARQLETALEQYHVPHDIKIYPNAQHSFFNDQRPNFNPDAAADAWQRVLAFFKTYLIDR
jgi:carboxymethylenebutenolidase